MDDLLIAVLWGQSTYGTKPTICGTVKNQPPRMDGWRKALLGETSVDEIVRVTKQDEFV